MILPAFSVPDTIIQQYPAVNSLMEQARNNGLISVGVVGETVYVYRDFWNQ
jgi:hypothetical protein